MTVLPVGDMLLSRGENMMAVFHRAMDTPLATWHHLTMAENHFLRYSTVLIPIQTFQDLVKSGDVRV